MSQNSSQPMLDRSDERMRHDDSLAAMARGFVDRVRSGDLGMLPVAIGLIVISTVFSILNPIFLAPNNLVNMLFDCATVGVISLGVVCVLMLGEIDLSVGSMSGLASAMVGVLWVNQGWPIGFAILAAMYRLGMPISAPQIRAAFDFARRGTAGNFYQLSGDRIAHVCVQAPELYQQVLERCAADHLEAA